MALQSIVTYSIFFCIMLLLASFASRPLYVSGTTIIYRNKKTSFFQVSTLLLVLCFAVFFGVRYDVGTDYLAYLYGYLHDIDVGKGEVLFEGLTHLFQSLDLHFAWYFGVIAFIQALFFYMAFNRDRFILPLLTFFLFMNGDFMFLMNGMRQAIALCIWVYALKFIEKQKLWHYLFWCLVAYGFHSSAVVLVVLYPILRNGKDYFHNIYLQLGMLAGAFAIQQVLLHLLPNVIPLIESYIGFLGNEAYQGYFTSGRALETVAVSGSGLAYYFRIGVAVLIILNSKKLKDFYHSKRFNILYAVFFIGLITMYMFPVGAIVLTRPFRYFYFFQFIMYAYFCYYLYRSDSVNNKLILIGMITAFVLIFYLNQLNGDVDSHLWYQTYFGIF